ncbi:DNA-processing protein DprA [Enterococcus sp. AZ109]|uniref:DNA-processing protein DprA n=1 Tax=Enterococcus sp. AZ109 TaxID=2774634 RepID=UPI003F23598E
MEKKLFLLRLNLTRGIGAITKLKIYRYAKKLNCWQFSSTDLYSLTKGKGSGDWDNWTKLRLEEILANQPMISIEDDEYPEHLRLIQAPPLILFYKGNLELLKRNSLSIVGARLASDYGYGVLREFMPELIKRQFVIVSGLAKGIDSYAHQFAISNQGKTIGVIGTGLDICYPKESGNLQIEMTRNHLVLSEYPKGTPPAKFHFPMRNRIIAGLGQGVLVIEAKQKSGSLITAQQALDSGKEVFAVPGSILNGRSAGCHQLIQDGAVCVEKVQNILDSLQLLKKIY